MAVAFLERAAAGDFLTADFGAGFLGAGLADGVASRAQATVRSTVSSAAGRPTVRRRVWAEFAKNIPTICCFSLFESL